MVRSVGRDLVRRDFYGPVPDWEALPADAFERESPLRGIDMDLDRGVSELRSLEPFLTEFVAPQGFHWGNRMYGRVEADVLHALIRQRKPARVIELGSGFSSLLITAAMRRNADEGHPGRYRVYDPYPRDFVRRGIDGMDFRPISARDVPLQEFEALEEGDVLFFDTSHTVKLGSEVNYLVLDVLPVLRPGVLVHVHDVFLPYEYPRSFFEKGMYWNEQYLLQAFLAQNPAWEVALPAFALARQRPEDVAALVPSYEPGCGPGAFWIRRRSS